MSGKARAVAAIAEDSGRARDLLASNRALLAWVRTSMAFAGLGFAVAQVSAFEPGEVRLSAAPGIVMVVIAVLMAVIGYLQHRELPAGEMAPPGTPASVRWPGVAVTSCCLAACVVLIPDLIVVAI
jgi:uncharacterized membrane protein YidH (DUF202 family)